MNEVYVMKIGRGYYQGREDRNGGQAEFSIFFEHLAMACNQIVNGRKLANMKLLVGPPPYKHVLAGKQLHLTDKTVTFVMNGLADRTSQIEFQQAREASDFIVFVLTDYNFVEDNMQMIEQSDFILHQATAPRYKSVLFDKPAAYSYIPELFYDATIPESKVKMDLCFFGGNWKGREDEFTRFLVSHGGKTFRDEFAVFYKLDEQQDFRIAYKEYRKMMSLFKFAFVSGRTAGKEIGWVTPRYVEAVNAGCVPIVIDDYDEYRHFGESPRAHSYQELQEVMSEIRNMSDGEVIDYVNDLRKAVLDGHTKFAFVIKEILESL